MRTLCGTILAATFAFNAAVAADFNVRDFGAKGDGTTKDTATIQLAIDKAVEFGGEICGDRPRETVVKWPFEHFGE